jgi:hypothetical protein
MERLKIYILSTIKNISQMEDGLDVVFLEVGKQLFFKERQKVFKYDRRIGFIAKVSIVKNN